eukprot:EG_transcript_14635
MPWLALLLLCLCHISRGGARQHFLAVCSRVGPQLGWYLDEWIAFHLVVGVSHFYLGVDERTEPHTRAVVERWMARGVVTDLRWLRVRNEHRIHLRGSTTDGFLAQCYDEVVPEAKWIALIDADEFLVPTTGCSVPALLKQLNPRLPWVPLWWMMFGSSHHVSRDHAGLIIEDFKWSGGNCSERCPPNADGLLTHCGECRHTKVLANSVCVRTARHVANHWVLKMDELPSQCLHMLDTHFKEGTDHFLYFRDKTAQRASQSLRLHHYPLYSREEFEFRRTAGDASPDFIQNLTRLWQMRDMNTHRVDSMDRFAAGVRKLLNLPFREADVQCKAPSHVQQKAKSGNWTSPELELGQQYGMPPKSPHQVIYTKQFRARLP